MSSPILTSPKSSSPIVSTKYSSLQSPEIIFSAALFGWVLIYLMTELLFFYGWFIYTVVAELLPASLRKPSCAFRGGKVNTFQKTPESTFVGCIYLSLFVIWYPYLDNLFFSDLSERKDWTRREWRRRKEVTNSAETTQTKLGYMDELSPEWCRKHVFLVFYIRNITHPCILCLTYDMLTLLSRVVYISQSCRLYNSIISQTYPKIRKCLDNSAVSFI